MSARSMPSCVAVLAEAVDHGGEDLERGGVAGEAVGVGEEIAFEGFGVGVRGEQVGDELGVLAFGGEEVVAFGEAGGLDGGWRCRRCCSPRGW